MRQGAVEELENARQAENEPGGAEIGDRCGADEGDEEEDCREAEEETPAAAMGGVLDLECRQGRGAPVWPGRFDEVAQGRHQEARLAASS